MMGGLGLLAVGTAFYNNNFAEAEESWTEVEITMANQLKDGDMSMLQVGDKDSDKVLIARY